GFSKRFACASAERFKLRGAPCEEPSPRADKGRPLSKKEGKPPPPVPCPRNRRRNHAQVGGRPDRGGGQEPQIALGESPSAFGRKAVRRALSRRPKHQRWR